MSEETIFAAALERRGPAERAAYLDAACGDDVAFRRRVEALLQAHESQDSLLDQPPALGDATDVKETIANPGATPGATHSEAVAAARSLVEGPGARIGPYKLLQNIGEGGMGTVFMAEQERPVRRRVALKIIKAGMDTGQVVARFEAERQALALMDHPNIAKVFDAGATETGRPYFVMELVKGIPITDYCDQAHLSPRERLELFVPVCQAIQHAHQKGIIHRDVKPSNVMVTLVDGKPTPKVIDFGVAKATDQKLTERSLFTQYGAVIGTLEYMSPEQAEMSALDVDSRSDVFSLGVLLYELLTGTTPLERARLRHAGYAEILRRIREEEPPRPSTRLSESGEALPSIAASRHTDPAKLTKLVRGELDWIVMKALEKDRTRRYETASGFARDVERYLKDEAVEACPPSRGYRLRKFARKNRVLLATASGFAALLAIGAGLSTWQAVRATRAEAHAIRERASALASYELARGAVDSYLNAITEDPDLNRADFHQLRRKLLETALPFYQSLIQGQPADSRQEAEYARAYHRLGTVYFRTGAMETALHDYRQAEAILERLVATPGGSAHREALIASQGAIGVALKDLNRLAEAEAENRRTLAKIDEFAAASPHDPTWKTLTAGISGDLAFVLDRAGKTAEAEAEYRRAYQSSRSLAAQATADMTRQAESARHGERLSAFLCKTDRMAEALGIMRQVIVGRETSLAGMPDDPQRQKDLGHSYGILANVLDGFNRFDEADTAYQTAFDRFMELAQRFPSVPNYRAQAATAGLNRGRLLTLLLRYADAEAVLRVTSDLTERLASDFPRLPEVVDLDLQAHNIFGVMLDNQGKYREAEEQYRKSQRIQRRLVADFPDDPNSQASLSSTLANLAGALGSQGKRAEAEAAHREANDVGRRLVARIPRQPSLRKDLAVCIVNFAAFLADEPSRRDEAIVLYREGIAEEERLVAELPETPEYASILAVGHNSFGGLLSKIGRHADAESEYRRSIQVSSKLVADFPKAAGFAVTLAGTHGNLGHYLRERGRPQDALGPLDEGIKLLAEVLKKSPGDKNTRLFLCNDYSWRAYALDDLGRHAEAAKDWRSALELSDPPMAPKYRLGEAVSLARADGRHDQALKLAVDSAAEEGIDPGALYSMACICATASRDAPDREAYAAEAVALLRLTLARGFVDGQLIRGDADFATLLQRPDFQAVIADAGRKSGAARPDAGKVER